MIPTVVAKRERESLRTGRLNNNLCDILTKSGRLPDFSSSSSENDEDEIGALLGIGKKSCSRIKPSARIVTVKKLSSSDSISKENYVFMNCSDHIFT